MTETTVELESHVRQKLRGQLRDFRLIIEDEGVILRGRSPSYYVKQLAQHSVMRATELRIVANEIEVC